MKYNTKETLRHSDAFEYYYGLGTGKRTIVAVGKKFNVSVQSIQKWSRSFHWQERIQLRDQEISQRVEKKTNTSIVNEKAKLLKILKSQIDKLLSKDELGKLDVSVSIMDQADLIKSMDMILKLTGEDPEGKTRRFIIGFNGSNNGRDTDSD